MSEDDELVDRIREGGRQWIADTLASQPEIDQFALGHLMIGAIRTLHDSAKAQNEVEPLPPIGPVTVRYPIPYDWEEDRIFDSDFSDEAIKAAAKADFTHYADFTTAKLIHRACTDLLLSITQSAAMVLQDGEFRESFLNESIAQKFEETTKDLSDDEHDRAIDALFDPIYFGEKDPEGAHTVDAQEGKAEIRNWYEFPYETPVGTLMIGLVLGIRPALIDHDNCEAFFPLEAIIGLFDSNGEHDCSTWHSDDRLTFWSRLEKSIELRALRKWRTTVLTETETNLADFEVVAERQRQVARHQEEALANEGIPVKSSVEVEFRTATHGKLAGMGYPSLQNSHSADFTSVTWNGRRYTFTKNQAFIVGLLWQAWERGNPTLSELTIGEALKSSSDAFRLRGVFRTRKQMHEAWGVMIVTPERGIYRLADPDAQKKLS